MPCWNTKVLSKNLHGYGMSRKVAQMLSIQHYNIRLSIRGVQKVNIYDSVWYVAKCCCSQYYYAKRLHIRLAQVAK